MENSQQDHRFDVLFERVPIGPVVAPNRFYQVPHCNGMGYRMPRALAAMRAMKAEGGWGVVCTEEVEIHPSSDLAPNIEGRLWEEADIPALALMAEAVHAHGALAGIELTYAGHHAPNLYSRAVPLGVRTVGVSGYHPFQSRQADKEDIRNIRRWHRQAALRAKKAGFDIIYCYAAHNLSLAMHFLLRRYNDRHDEYGGSLENRVRLLRELLEDTHEAVGDCCAVAVRLAVDELLGEEGLIHQGEGHDIVALLAEIPDLWDVNISGWSHDSATSRFEKEGYQESYIAFVKSLTSKPVVGVGRYTTPEAMLSVVRGGVMDLVGSARPSIADPFLPQKIREGRLEDIRECIGCNICLSADELFVPIRCTQNPTMGEEWRRGWHPELNAPGKNALGKNALGKNIQGKNAPGKSARSVLVIGAGPAGLECALSLGARGYTVELVEGRHELGGRVALESKLPGLSEWRRVMDWRLTQIEKMSHVRVYPDSYMSAGQVLESGIRDVIVACGATWRADGVGRTVLSPLPGCGLPQVYTPDDLMRGRLPRGDVLVYDDDHYYMGSVLSELLVRSGCQVSLVTAAPLVAYWTQYTLEQERTQKQLMKLGVEIYTQQRLEAIHPDHAELVHVVSGRALELPQDAVVLVTDRLPNDALYRELKASYEKGELDSLRLTGDALAPNIIAGAVFSGHLAAREFDDGLTGEAPFRVERVRL